MENSQGWGQISLSNAMGWDQKRRQMPHPRDHLESNTAQDLIIHNEKVSLIIILNAVWLFTHASILPLFISFNATYQ